MKRGIFITIEGKEQAKKSELKEAYLGANEDPGQQEAMKEWKDTFCDVANHSLSKSLIFTLR